MAVGSLIIWWAGSRMPRLAGPVAALGALLAAACTALVGSPEMLMDIRAVYGFAMGLIYTQAMSDAAAGRPNGAYGAVFLLQLILSSICALLLPAVADATSPGVALATLCAVPLLALLLSISRADIVPHLGLDLELPQQGERRPVPAAGWALAAATFLIICSTMMVWSFTGALAVQARISEDIIGGAVAIGSIAGALTALTVMREQPIIPLPVTGFLSGLALLSPIFATSLGGPMLFVAAVILLNIGSTAIIIRGSGMATAQSRDPLFRRLVACTHPLGMIVGPVIGSVATSLMGTAGLLTAAIATISAAVGAFGISQRYRRLLQLQPADLDELHPVSPTTVHPVLQGGDI